MRHAFSVKQELMIVMVFCACMRGFNPTTNNIDDGVLILYLILLRSIGFFIITILLPLFARNTNPRCNNGITSLQAILDDMDACVYFRQFMTEQDSQYLFILLDFGTKGKINWRQLFVYLYLLWFTKCVAGLQYFFKSFILIYRSQAAKRPKGNVIFVHGYNQLNLVKNA